MRLRRCWSTLRSRPSSCRACWPSCTTPGSSWSATSELGQRLAESRSVQPAKTTGISEYLDLKLAVAVVDSLEEAIDHVNRHGTRHSEAIVTRSDQAAARFTAAVDAAVVYTNASTRFTDGFEFGMGAEIGNSTQKLHARGPIGLRELTTYKYVVRGDGQVRE